MRALTLVSVVALLAAAPAWGHGTSGTLLAQTQEGRLGPLISGERPLLCRQLTVSQKNLGMERHAAPLVENAGRF